MNTLPPLPLTRDASGALWLFIDNSSIENLTTCPRAFEYSWLRKKRGAGLNAALNFGTAMHHALDTRYASPDYAYLEGDTEQRMFNAVTKHFEEFPQPEDDHRSLDYATNMIIAYNKKYSVESFEVCQLEDGRPCVEMPYAVPLLEDNEPSLSVLLPEKGITNIRIMYTGKIDIVTREFNQLYTIDHKTAFMFGSKFWQEQQMSGQHVGYCWSVDKVLKVNTAGYRINAMRTTAPTKKKLGPNSEDLERNLYYITPERKEEWRRNLIAVIEEFLWNYSRGCMPMRVKWCVGKYGACQFFDVCSLPQDQRTLVLKSGLYVDDEWSPLQAVKTTKQT